MVSAGARKLVALWEAASRLFGGADDGGTSLRGCCAAGHAAADAEAVRGRLSAKLSTLSLVPGENFRVEESGCICCALCAHALCGCARFGGTRGVWV